MHAIQSAHGTVGLQSTHAMRTDIKTITPIKPRKQNDFGSSFKQVLLSRE
jgi:hypothetical protein